MGRLDFAHHKWCDVIKADQIFQRYFVQQLLATVSEYLQLFFFSIFLQIYKTEIWLYMNGIYLELSRN